MKRLLNFILWPAIAGLVFSISLLQAPRLTQIFPVLDSITPATTVTNHSTLSSFSEAIQKAAPAVVRIQYQEQVYTGDDFSFEIGRRIPDNFQENLSRSNNLGSGIIISPDGYIITSYHIFPPLDNTGLYPKLTVTLSDSRSYEARQLISDEENDLSLLKIDAVNLKYLNPIEDQRLQVGDIVLAIGNPRNIGQSVSMGIISALLRRDDTYVIQTDAAINPGNSGGALIDINGNLIGINSTIVSESGGSEGIGFSTPAQIAMALLENYIQSGPGGYLGVTNAELLFSTTPFGVPLQGILINEIAERSPAMEAGIKTGDIIIGINGQKLDMRDENDLIKNVTMISNFGSGANITLEIYRNGTVHDIKVTLGVGEPKEIYSIIGE